MDVDEDHVFLVTPTELERIGQEDGPEVLTLNSHASGSSIAGSRSVSVNEDYVFESGGTNVGNSFVNRLPKTGGTPLDIFFSSGADFSNGYPRGVTAGPVRVLWSVRNSDLNSTNVSLRGVASDGGDPEYYAFFSENTGIRSVSNGTYAYWYDPFEDELRRELLTGEVSEAVLAGVSSVDSLVADEQRLYFSGEVGGTYALYSVEFDGSGLQSLLTAASILLDEDQHYGALFLAGAELGWLNATPSGDTINIVGTDGSNPRSIYTGAGNVELARGDDDAYFWYEDDQVWMLVK